MNTPFIYFWAICTVIANPIRAIRFFRTGEK